MHSTASLFYIVVSELKRAGFDEFGNKVDPNAPYQLTFFDPNFSFIQRVNSYDNEIAKALQRPIFGGFQFKDKEVDDFFKKSFLNAFLERDIKFQTLDIWRSHLVALMIQDSELIRQLVLNAKNFYEGGGETTTDNHQKNGYNEGSQDLPQDLEVLNLTLNSMERANNAKANRGFVDTFSRQDQTNFNPDVIDKMRGQWQNLFKKYDKLLFSQVR